MLGKLIVVSRLKQLLNRVRPAAASEASTNGVAVIEISSANGVTQPPHSAAEREYNPVNPNGPKRKFSKEQRRHWSKWIDRTNLHGPRELFYAKSFAEKSFWVVLISTLIVWTCVTSGTIFSNYLSHQTAFDTRAVSPSDEEVFQLLEIVFCSTHWINESKATEMGLSPELLDYASLLLDLVNGDGLDLLESENLSDPGVRLHYTALDTKLNDFIANTDSIKNIRDFYESIAIDYTSDVVKRKLCPHKKGNFCFYTHKSQVGGGFTIRKGRVCQQLMPKRDLVATLDPLQNEINVEFHLEIDHDILPDLYKDRDEIKTSIRMYLGELISTGLSRNTGLSFDDIIFLPVNGSRFCETRVLASMYHLTRLSTPAKPCKDVNPSYRHPQNYPADTCRLRCVDAIFYKKDQSCSLFDPLYHLSDDYAKWKLCSPIQLYDAMNSEELTPDDRLLYEDCDTKQSCGRILPCDEWLGDLQPVTSCSMTPPDDYNLMSQSELERNVTRLKIFMNPVSILVINERMLYSFAYTYSSIGGVMGLTLGASIVSITHFLMYCIKNMGHGMRYMSSAKEL